MRVGWGNQDSRGRDGWVWCSRGAVAAFWVRRGWKRLAVFALRRVSGTRCHPRGGEAASQMCMWEGALESQLGCAPSLGTAPLSGCSVGRGSGHQSARLGMCTNSYGNHTKNSPLPLPPALETSFPSILSWIRYPPGVCFLFCNQRAFPIHAHVCMYMFSRGLVPENTPPLPHPCCTPNPHFFHPLPPSAPVSWSGDPGVSLVPFADCSGQRAVRTPGLTRKRAQALNSSRALCLMGRPVGEAPGWSRDGLEPWGFPCGEGGGDESGGGNKRESIWSWRKKVGVCGGGRVVESGSLWSQGVCGCERCWCTGRGWDISSAWESGPCGPSDRAVAELTLE